MRRPSSVLRRLAVLAILGLCGTALLSEPARADEQRGHSHQGGAWLPTTPDQWPLVVDEAGSAPQAISHGIGHWVDRLRSVGGAQVAQVLDVNLADPNVRLGVIESHDHLTDPQGEVLTSMAGRTGAVAGINGDFFEIHGTGRPLGMVMIDGRLVKSPNPNWTASLGVRADGSVVIGTESYSGTMTDGSASRAITSVNTVNDLATGGLVRLTPDLGPTALPAATVAAAHTAPDGALVVDSITSAVSSLGQLTSDQQDLAGSGASGDWLAQNVHPGDRLAINEQISPDSGLRQAVSGGAILVQNGKMAVPVQGGGENNVPNPVTGLGVTRDGRHVFVAVFDGHQPESAAEGLTRPQLAGWMMQHGAYNAILFDSGGSSEMVGRLPGQRQVTVLNTPSDGRERPVANGLFFFSTEQQPGPASRVVVNAGQPLNVLGGGPVVVAASAFDAADNPAREPVQLSVLPSRLASISGSELTGLESGEGVLVAQAGTARAKVPLTVTDRIGRLSIDPSAPDLGNGDSQQLTVQGFDAEDRPVALPAQAISWKVEPAALGTISPSGVFIAASSGAGLATVTASAGGASAAASVAVGADSQLIDPMTDVSAFGLSDKYMNIYPRNVPSPGPHAIEAGTVSPSTLAPPGGAGSLQLHYLFPAGQHVWHLDLYPNDPGHDVIPTRNGQVPAAIGVWVKAQPALTGGIYMSEGIYEASNQPDSLYPAGPTTSDWHLVVMKLRSGFQYPLRLNYINLVVINPQTTLSGDFLIGGLVALYSPRQPAPYHYVPVPDNPSWLRYTPTTARFKSGGTTIATMDDAHLTAAGAGNTESVVMASVAGRIAQSTGVERPTTVQALGDMSDSGRLEDLQTARQALASTGIDSHNAVGNHEISQGVVPENGHFASVFGPTHYAYDAGPARVIVTDSAHSGILGSDPFQVPSEEQYRWLAGQLDVLTAPVAVVITHMPAYDPHPAANSQFTDRWEAQMYERLLQRYQQTHPHVHVVLLFGHARGYAEQLLLPDGSTDRQGLPNFTIADAGAPPYAPVDQGGFYHYALFHVLPDGTVQFAVEPVLQRVTVTVPGVTLRRGDSMQASAAGITPTGSDRPALQVPIGDPMARTWISSDPRVLAVDPVDGLITARHRGTATVTCRSGGASGSVQVTVTGQDDGSD